MAGGVEIKVDSSKGVDRIIKGLEKCKQKEAISVIANMLVEEINKYVPERSGTLKEKGYLLRTGTPANKPSWIKIKYRNLKSLPYVMYQYEGVVWGPNFAQFTPNGTQIPGAWKSAPKGKRRPQTKYPLGTKRTVTLKDGRVVNIDGYTGNPNAHAKWVEYVRHTSTIWTPLRTEMLKKMKEFAKEGINGN